MKKLVYMTCVSVLIMTIVSGCGKSKEPQKEIVENFEDIVPLSEQVIVRDEENNENESVTEAETQSETETQAEEIIPYADRVAGDNEVTYNVEASVYENGNIKINYPVLSGMENKDMENQINENIKNTVMRNIPEENTNSYELNYETATKGKGIVSFIFKGYEYYAASAHPVNIVKTLNIDLNTGKNIRLKDYADISYIVSSLEQASGYSLADDGVDMEDFSRFLNNGSVTDYAITLLDYDVDFENTDMIPVGYSAIKDNRIVLFIEAEHAMGDYVELIFNKDL